MVDTAISPTTRSPGVAVKVNLLSGAGSAGTTALKTILIVAKGAGSLAVNTVSESVNGEDAAGDLIGIGSPGHLSAKAFFACFPRGRLDVICATAVAGAAATGTFVFGGSTPTAAQTVKAYIKGVLIEYVWNAGVATAAAAAAFNALVNAKTSLLPVTAGVAASTVTVTAKIHGTWGNDIKIRVTITSGVGTVTVSGANMAGGSGETDPTAALTAISAREYDYMVVAVNGNTDTYTAASTTAVAKAKTQVDASDTGLYAKLQQLIVGGTGSLTSAKVGTGFLNFTAGQMIFCRDAESLPAEIAGFEAGSRANAETDDPTVNRINTVYASTLGATLYGPSDRVAGPLSEIELEDALQNGITPVVFDTSGNAMCSRPITMYFKDTGGNSDDRCLDVSRPTGVYAVVKDLRTFLARRFPQAKLVPDQPVGAQPLPPGCTEERDIKASTIARMKGWADRGVLERTRLLEVIASGELVCQIDPSDDTQIDLVLPMKTVRPLAKVSIVANQIA